MPIPTDKTPAWARLERVLHELAATALDLAETSANDQGKACIARTRPVLARRVALSPGTPPDFTRQEINDLLASAVCFVDAIDRERGLGPLADPVRHLLFLGARSMTAARSVEPPSIAVHVPIVDRWSHDDDDPDVN